MALQGWEQEKHRVQQENKVLKQLMISGATGQGGSPGQLYRPPVTNPGRGEAVYGTEKDGQRFFEFLKAMMIDPANNIRRTGKPLANDDDYGEGNVPGHPDWKLAGGPQLPNFKPMGRVIEGTRKGVLSPEENKITRPLQIGPQAMDYPPPSELDRWLQLYQRNGGSLRHLDPDLRRLILQRGAMKAEAANNIRRLGDTGHQTVIDDNNPNRLKIIKQFQPPRA